ncbi:major capsid protein [Frog virus 3]|uniref:Major capsid protein n=1 Tax=Frog virus 3 TaxID=10493 RepID=A0A5B8P2B6_FRG3V|nr:major capsid protein [Frog virus 3]
MTVALITGDERQAMSSTVRDMVVEQVQAAPVHMVNPRIPCGRSRQERQPGVRKHHKAPRHGSRVLLAGGALVLCHLHPRQILTWQTL